MQQRDRAVPSSHGRGQTASYTTPHATSPDPRTGVRHRHRARGRSAHYIPDYLVVHVIGYSVHLYVGYVLIPVLQ